MDPQLLDKIKQNPKYIELVSKRSRLARLLTALMLIIYFGFVLLVAFAKPFLATPIGGGVTTVGIPLGLLVIVSAFVLTGIYVRRANGEFDQLTKAIVDGVKK